jgi:hypothetical protein
MKHDCSTPNRLLNALQEHFDVKFDSALADKLGYCRDTITRYRKKEHTISRCFLNNARLKTGWQIEKVYLLAGFKLLENVNV